MEQSICKAFQEYEYLVKAFVKAHSTPYWNGEDIFMSLVANHVYGYSAKGEYKNCAYPEIPMEDIGRTDGIHGKVLKKKVKGAKDVRKLHEMYRGRLWRIARDKLKNLG